MIATQKLRPLYRRAWVHNLKIPLFYAAWIGLGALAWKSLSPWVDWPCYVAMGYLQMSILTFMHDATHGVLFKARWKNRAFGVLAMIPFVTSFIGFQEDHLEHHKHNRSPRDPDSFTMGKRHWNDFLQFYAYIFLGMLLSAIYFTFLYPMKSFNARQWRVHLGELALHAAVYAAALWWAEGVGRTGDLLRVWLIPLVFFGYLNSIRFLAEHYGTPWNAGQLAGTRTILSNPVNRFFWNNINYHIGHHVYPGVPWYNLPKLHIELLPEIRKAGAIVDRSYLVVFFRAFLRGPELPDTADIRGRAFAARA